MTKLAISNNKMKKLIVKLQEEFGNALIFGTTPRGKFFFKAAETVLDTELHRTKRRLDEAATRILGENVCIRGLSQYVDPNEKFNPTLD